MSRRAWFLAGAGYLLVLLAVYHQVWWGGGQGRMFFGWDCLREYWPDLVFPVHAFRDGEAPLWNPYSLGGYPFVGDPQAGLFAPVNWLCWGLAGLTRSEGAWLIQVKVLLNLWIGLVGMHALVWRRTRSHAAAAVGAFVWIFGSPLLVHKNGAFMWPFCYLPWAMLALERFRELPSVRRGTILAVAVWLCGSAGHPQAFFYSLVILFAYWAFSTALPPRQIWASLRRQARGLAAFVPIVLLLLLPTYLPAAQAVAASPRAHRGLAYVVDGGLPAAELPELLIPNLDGDWQGDVYVGVLALILALFALAAAPSRRALAERIFWWGLGVLGILLALGSQTPVLPAFARHVPGFGLFRIAYRHKLIFGFAAAILAGDGAGEIVRGTAPRWARIGAAALAGAWLAGVALARLAWLHGPSAHASSLALIWAGPSLVLAGAALLLRSAPKARSWLMAALAVFTLGDLWAAGLRKIAIMQPPPRPEADSALVSRLEGAHDRWRYFVDGTRALPYSTPYLREIRELSGFLNPITLARQVDVEARATRSPDLLRHFNVRWLIGARPALADVHPLGPRVWELPDPTPLVRAYSQAERAPAARTLDRLAQAAPLTAALVDPSDNPPPLPSGTEPPVDGVVRSYQRNRLELEVTTASPAIAVVNEAYYPGWQATVNGAPAEVFRANYFLRAVVVPAGTSHIVMRFVPPGYSAALAGFAVAALLVGLALAARWRWLTAAAPGHGPVKKEKLGQEG